MVIAMRAVKILGIILFLFIFMGIVFWKCNLNYYYDVRAFPTYNAAGGFLPEFAPPSATDIRYIHCTESPDKWIVFNFDIEEISKIRTYCGGPVHGEIEFAPPPPGYFIDWPEKFIDWPKGITSDAPVKAEDIAGYEFYRCKYRKGFLSVNTKKGKAYYWEIY